MGSRGPAQGLVSNLLDNIRPPWWCVCLASAAAGGMVAWRTGALQRDPDSPRRVTAGPPPSPRSQPQREKQRRGSERRGSHDRRAAPAPPPAAGSNYAPGTAAAAPVAAGPPSPAKRAKVRVTAAAQSAERTDYPLAVYLGPGASIVFQDLARYLSEEKGFQLLAPPRGEEGTSEKLNDMLRNLGASRSSRGSARLGDVVPQVILGDRHVTDSFISWMRDEIARSQRALQRLRPGAPQPVVVERKFLVNYWFGSKELTHKAYMVKHLRASEPSPWEITPMTFVVQPHKGSGSQKGDERQRFKKECDATGNSAIWICKPARKNKAIGIKVLRRCDDVLRHIDNNKDDQDGVWVVQRYIERPMLVHNRKFDVRIWVVLDQFYNAWMWRHGVCRTATVEYSLKDLSDNICHLTNHCVQETAAGFGEIIPGNELWFDQFQEYLDSQGVGLDFRRQTIPAMKAIVKRTLASVQSRMGYPIKPGPIEMHCYQPFGFDFMLDSSHKVWLIEVNAQPGMAEALLAQFTRDTADLVMPPVLSPNSPRRVPPSFELCS